jgi:prolyl-tRNA synthetase
MGKDTKGLTATKEDDFSEWFTQLIQKAELIEYSPVSGCYILRPNSYSIWEKVRDFFDKLIKDDGVQNAYFPLFIPESLLTKEADHVEGFAPEVAWVETGGSTKLKERLAVRPTSETIMYDAYSKWIRSHTDLPIRLNQWNNVVRWEFKHCTPFLRSREFLWQEGHSAFATEKEVAKDTLKMLDFYAHTFEELYAIPTLKGKKSDSEKFAGAQYTLSVEAFLPNGKAIQGATSHHLGQNFGQAFDIRFTDKDQKEQYVWQNSWGLSTRSIGVMTIMHSDDKGLVLPPKVAHTHAVIVPILFDDSKIKVLEETQKIKQKLQKAGLTVHVDDREGYSPGWKFNEWEMKGVPLRLELGPRDLQNKQVMVARRDTGEKQALPIAGIEKSCELLLDKIQDNLFNNAKKLLKESIVEVQTFKEAEKAFKDQKIVYTQWCGHAHCEEDIKEKTTAKSLNSPLKQDPVSGNCFHCKEPARFWFYFGKSY